MTTAAMERKPVEIKTKPLKDIKNKNTLTFSLSLSFTVFSSSTQRHLFRVCDPNWMYANVATIGADERECMENRTRVRHWKNAALFDNLRPLAAAIWPFL